MKHKELICLILACFLLSGIAASSAKACPPPEKIVNNFQGELTGKYISADGMHRLNLYNSNEEMRYTSLEVTKKQYKRAIIGQNYEWIRTTYPEGRITVLLKSI